MSKPISLRKLSLLVLCAMALGVGDSSAEPMLDSIVDRIFLEQHEVAQDYSDGYKWVAYMKATSFGNGATLVV